MSDRALLEHYPAPYGYSQALENVGTSAAPLLAGFSITLIVLVVDNEDALGQPNLALALIVGAALVLIAAVQFAFTARQYYVAPAEAEEILTLAGKDGRAVQRELVVLQLDLHARWLTRTRYAYNLGIVLLLLGIAIVLVPKGTLFDASALRVATVALVVAGAIAEALWTLVPSVRAWIVRRSEAGGGEAA